MPIFRPLSLLFVITLGLHYHLLAQGLQFTKEPGWVKPQNPVIESQVTKYDINAGYYTSMCDYQLNLETEEDYTHVIIEVLTGSGVTQASQVYISYDTSYQELQFHHLYIWRDGEKIDKTGSLTFETLKNEENLSTGIYTGLITAYEIVEDVRKGDKIEYSYTLVGDNPIFDSNAFRMMPLETINPIDYYSLRVLHSNERQYDHACVGCPEEASTTRVYPDHTEISYLATDVEAVDMDQTIPSWHIPFDYFVISSFEGWKDVNEWALGVFTLDELPEFTTLLPTLIKEDDTTEEKIDKLINFVQDDINYMGIESGIGSIKPFTPHQVLKQRYGDCKDKSLLLASLLKEIGVENSYPALVNSSLQHTIGDILPGGQLFNHCIVYFEFEDQPFWIDPTASLQGGDFRSMQTYDYGKALVVRENNETLTDMEIEDKVSRTEISEEITLESFTGPGELKVTTKMYGLHADYLRTILEYYSVKELSDDYRNTYSYVFPNISEKVKMTVNDDEEENIMTTTEQYVIEDIWKVKESKTFRSLNLRYEPVSLYNYISTSNCEQKKQPVQLNYPAQFRQSTKITLPDNMKLDKSSVQEDNEFFSYFEETELIDKKILTLSYAYTSKAKQIDAEKYKEVCMTINALVDDLPMMIYYTKLTPKKKKKKKK